MHSVQPPARAHTCGDGGRWRAYTGYTGYTDQGCVVAGCGELPLVARVAARQRRQDLLTVMWCAKLLMMLVLVVVSCCCSSGLGGEGRGGYGAAGGEKPVGPGLSIGTAFKGCQRPCWLNSTTQNLWPFGDEITVFQHACRAATGCKLKHLWTGGTWPGYHNSRVRYYVDGEQVASVDFPIGLGAGSSMLEDVSQPPFSAGDLFGWTGRRAKGGVWNTYQVPFSTSVRVTVELLTTQPVGQRQHDPVGFWLILRGTEGGTEGSAVRLPGGVMLPAAARLRSFENMVITVAGGSTVDLLRSDESDRQVAVLTVSLAVSSNQPGLSFLEGCVRAHSKNNLLQLLSSGTEDFFVGTFYFESGVYTNALAGVTRLNSSHGVPSCVWEGAPSGEPACTAPAGATFSAYRVLGGVDPLVLQAPATISWRNGDSAGCDLTRPGGTYAVNVSSIVLYYSYETQVT
jgi:hypothetical protein